MPLVPLAMAGAVRFAPATARTIEPGRDLYPAEALAAGLEGDVPVTLSVDPSGALRCAAHGDVALTSLKRASCQLIADRDVFVPRVAKDGTMAENHFELTVRWRLTADESRFGGAVPIGRAWWVRHFDNPFMSSPYKSGGRMRVGFDVNEYGHVEACAVTTTSYSLALDKAVCPLLLKRAAFLPALGPDGRPRRTHASFSVSWRPVPLTEDFSADADDDG